MDTTVLAKAVYSLDKHKGEMPVALDVATLTSIADVFLLVSGGSSTQVRSLAEYLEKELAEQGIRPLRSDGYQAGEWITLDYGDMMVHIFRRDIREFYGLEHLWADAARMDISEYLVKDE